MGSSKKHKKDHKHKKHKRSSPSRDDRDKEDSPDIKKRRYEDESKKSKSKHHKSHKKSSGSYQDEERSRQSASSVRREEPHAERVANGRGSEPAIKSEPVEEASSGREAESLSVGETNKLRLKLGLKPLQVKGAGASDGANEKKEDFVHAPAEDLWKKKKQDEMREKLKAIKEKRSINKKMGKIKTIGEDAEDDDASAWVERSRIIQQKKQKALAREKELAAMDAEFGVGNLVEKELEQSKNTAYTARNLEGMSVKHSLGMFKEGKSEVLTLEDREILDSNQEDTLVSTNLIDAEKTQKNLENKKQGIGYKAYEEESVDELGFFKQKSLLSKYDEEIDGQQKDKFTIGKQGAVDITWEQQKVQMKNEIQAKGVSLAMPELKIASEYLTEEEMTKFKKRKKKVRKVRKRETFKVDDLLPLPGSSSTNDLGSRSGNIPGWDEGMEVAKVDDTSITSTTLLSENRTVIVDEDDAGSELQKALDKARKAKWKKVQPATEDAGAAKVAERIESLAKFQIVNPAANYSTTISLNSTDEFCRQLGTTTDLNTIKEDPIEEEDVPVEEDMDIEDPEESAPGWNFVNAEVPKVNQPKSKDDSHAPIEAEPLATGGLMGALKLAERKGYLVDEKVTGVVTVTNLNSQLLSKNYSIEDKNAVDHLDKYAHEKYSKDRNRYNHGIVTEFEEKKNYKPAVNIEYVDEGGRLMNPKEAFRKLSHRFHGKGSGKMKLEKRQKKQKEKDMMMHMNSTDTPLNTVAMMKEKLKTEASPYIVLSGAGKTLQAGGPGLMSKK